MNKYLIGLVVIVLAIGAFFFLTKSSNNTQVPTTQAVTPTEAMKTETPTSGDAMMKSETKEFTVEASNFKFVPAEIKVKKGDTVKITFKNAGGFHDFNIDEFNVKTKQIQGGSEEVVQFTPDQVGTFEYYCSVGNHRAMGMKGNLIVE